MTAPDPGAGNAAPGDTNADGNENAGVTAPEADSWWQFANKEAAEKWGNDLITKRLTRHTKTVVNPLETERDTLKAEVERLRPLEDAKKTDVQRFEDRLNAVLPELESLRDYKAQTTHSELVRSIAEELGLPVKFVSRVRGKDEDAIRDDISELLNVLSEDGPNAKKVPPAKAPKESDKSDKKNQAGGGGQDDESEESLIADILGQVTKDRARGGLTTRR